MERFEQLVLTRRVEGRMPGIMVVPFLVLRQAYIDGFSWPVSVQGKARLAANGHSPLQEA